MNVRNIIMVSITVAIGAVILAGVLVPAVAQGMKTEETFTNEGFYSMNLVGENDEIVIEWTKETPNVITIDGNEFDMSFVQTNLSYTLVGNEDFVIRYQKDNTVTGIQSYGGATYQSFHTGTSSGTKVTITVTATGATYQTDTTSPINTTYSTTNPIYVITDGEGEYSYVMKNANKPAYVFGDSNIYFIGVSVSAGPNGIGVYGSGTLDDGVELSTIYKPGSITTVTYSDPIPTYTKVTGYNDLYSLEKYNFTITYDDNSYDATYSYFIVPAEVTAELAIHADSTTRTLLSIIPIFVALGLIVAIASVVYVKYRS